MLEFYVNNSFREVDHQVEKDHHIVLVLLQPKEIFLSHLVKIAKYR